MNASHHPQRVMFVALLVAALSPSFLQEYGFSDDFQALDAAQRSSPEMWRLMAGGGRLALSVVSAVAFSSVDSVARLAWLRLVSVLGVAACGILLERAFRSALGQDRPSVRSYSAALVIVSLPAFTLYAAWAVQFLFPSAIALTGVAWEVQRRAEGTRFRWDVAACGLSGLLVGLSFLVYQPAAAFYWVFFLLHVFTCRGHLGLRPLLRATSAYAIGGVIAVAGLLVGQAMYPGVLPPERAGFVRDLSAKLEWFFREPLLDALNLFLVRHSSVVALAVAAVVVVGVPVCLRGRRLGVASLLVVAATLLAASPALVASESWPSWRSLVGFHAAVATAFVLAGYALLIRIPRGGTLIGDVALVSTGALALVCSSHTMQRFFIQPQSQELAYVRSMLSPPRLDGATSVLLIQPGPHDTPSPARFHDEFGTASTFGSWAAAPMARVVLRERAAGELPIDVVRRLTRDTVVRPNALVLDMRWLSQMRAPGDYAYYGPP